MYQTVNTTNQFRDAFVQMDRGDSYSYNAFKALFEYFEEIEEASGESIELDPIAICCDWDELTFDQLKEDYSHVDGMDECEVIDDVEELLREHTAVIPVEGNPYLRTEDTLLVRSF